MAARGPPGGGVRHAEPPGRVAIADSEAPGQVAIADR